MYDTFCCLWQKAYKAEVRKDKECSLPHKRKISIVTLIRDTNGWGNSVREALCGIAGGLSVWWEARLAVCASRRKPRSCASHTADAQCAAWTRADSIFCIAPCVCFLPVIHLELFQEHVKPAQLSCSRKQWRRDWACPSHIPTQLLWLGV